MCRPVVVGRTNERVARSLSNNIGIIIDARMPSLRYGSTTWTCACHRPVLHGTLSDEQMLNDHDRPLSPCRDGLSVMADNNQYEDAPAYKGTTILSSAIPTVAPNEDAEDLRAGVDSFKSVILLPPSGMAMNEQIQYICRSFEAMNNQDTGVHIRIMSSTWDADEPLQKQWKQLCDAQLPGLRSGSYSHNIIFKCKLSNMSQCLLARPACASPLAHAVAQLSHAMHAVSHTLPACVSPLHTR